MGFTEKSAKEALEDYILGRPVTVTWMNAEGKREFMDLDEILGFDGNRFLVDMPDDLTKPAPEEIIQAVHDTQESITPPTEPEERMEEETIDLPADNIEEKKEKIRKLVEEGYTNREIADQTGIPFGTVGYHAARFRKKERGPVVDNSDRHLCKTCKFRSNRPTVNSCDYAGIMKHSRGCKVEECTKYKKGARMRLKDAEE